MASGKQQERERREKERERERIRPGEKMCEKPRGDATVAPANKQALGSPGVKVSRCLHLESMSSACGWPIWLKGQSAKERLRPSILAHVCLARSFHLGHTAH